MNILYIANIRLPTEKAHGVQIMKMCEAFALSGHKVTLLIPRRDNPIKEDPFKFYSIKRDGEDGKNIDQNFSIKYISMPRFISNFLNWGKFGYVLQSMIFAEKAALFMWRIKPDAIYSRDELVLLNMILLGKKLIWESHRGTINIAVKILLKKAKVVVITNALKDLYRNYISNEDRILVAPDAVDIEVFVPNRDKDECRDRVGLPKDKKIALYGGHLYTWKGADTLAKASALLGEDECVVFVGGTEKDVQAFREKYKDNTKMMILGQKPYKDIPIYFQAADVLVLPNSSKEKISNNYTSPMKLFEYMACKRVIVASRIPSILEILDKDSAIFFESDNHIDLSDKLKEAFTDTTLGQKLALNAYDNVQNYTWQKRVINIVKFVS